MTLKKAVSRTIPEETAQVARLAYPKGSQVIDPLKGEIPASVRDSTRSLCLLRAVLFESDSRLPESLSSPRCTVVPKCQRPGKMKAHGRDKLRCVYTSHGCQPDRLFSHLSRASSPAWR
jgi:hypothetical protein